MLSVSDELSFSPVGSTVPLHVVGEILQAGLHWWFRLRTNSYGGEGASPNLRDLGPLTLEAFRATYAQSAGVANKPQPIRMPRTTWV